MNYQEIISTLFFMVVVPLLTVLTTYLVTLIKKKTLELESKIENEELTKYLLLAQDILTSCIKNTNEVFVNELKKDGKLDKESAKKAFEMTKKSFEDLATEDCKKALNMMYGDYMKWIDTTIESMVNDSK